MPIKRLPANEEERKIFSILNEIDEISHTNGIYTFIVGGFCRNEYLGKPHRTSEDIDLMAENYNGLILAGFLGSYFKVPVEYSHKSGTAKIHIDGIKFDFKANIKKYDILPLLRETNLPQNNLTFDLISRDFTINTLIIGLRSGHMYDILGRAKKDLDAKILITPIEPNIAIKNDPIIFIRALKFSLRDNYKISKKLDDAMLKNLNSLEKLPYDETKKDLLEYYKLNPQKAKMLYERYGIIKGFLGQKT